MLLQGRLSAEVSLLLPPLDAALLRIRHRDDRAGGAVPGPCQPCTRRTWALDIIRCADARIRFSRLGRESDIQRLVRQERGCNQRAASSDGDWRIGASSGVRTLCRDIDRHCRHERVDVILDDSVPDSRRMP